MKGRGKRGSNKVGKHIKSKQKAERNRWHSVPFYDVGNIHIQPFSFLVFDTRTSLQSSLPKPLNHYFAINLNFLRPIGLVAHHLSCVSECSGSETWIPTYKVAMASRAWAPINRAKCESWHSHFQAPSWCQVSHLRDVSFCIPIWNSGIVTGSLS